MPSTGRKEITEPIELARVGDRIHFDIISDGHRWPFSVSFHKARNATFCATLLLDEAEGKRRGNVMPFTKRS